MADVLIPPTEPDAVDREPENLRRSRASRVEILSERRFSIGQVAVTFTFGRIGRAA